MAVQPDLAWVWRAWTRLTHDRPMHSAGMGGSYPGRIPWVCVVTWCDRHGYSDGERDFMDEIFQALDADYLDWVVKQQKAKQR